MLHAWAGTLHSKAMCYNLPSSCHMLQAKALKPSTACKILAACRQRSAVRSPWRLMESALHFLHCLHAGLQLPAAPWAAASAQVDAKSAAVASVVQQARAVCLARSCARHCWVVLCQSSGSIPCQVMDSLAHHQLAAPLTLCQLPRQAAPRNFV